MLTPNRFLLSIAAVFALAGALFSQNISGIINRYAAVSAIDYCASRLLVSDTAGFRAGDQILLLQMQGAEILSPNSSSFGNISELKNAGRYERALIDSVAANAIFLRQRLVNQYDTPSGSVQIVSFPVFQNAKITAALRPKPWDGATGGVLALEVLGTLTMNAPIVADTCGFRGGANFVAADNNCYFLFSQNDFHYPAGSWRGAPKGEGIAPILLGKELGRGAQANGGGGGNDHNAGGGGGAHLSNGGIGGENDEPNTTGCSGHFPGEAGKKITAAGGRIFLGGGGGAGHTNNLFRSAGGNGGGIVVLIANTITGSKPMVSANGESAQRANGDGGGGGGAGGTIICQVASTPADFSLQADGGKGGDTRTPGEERCFGPGGGGAGGRVLCSYPAMISVAAGQPGIVFASDSPCVGTSNGAAAGAAGKMENFAALPAGTISTEAFSIAQQPVNQEVCENNAAVFTCSATGSALQFRWQTNTGAGWEDLSDGGIISGANTPELALQSADFSKNGHLFRCLVESPGCFLEITNAAQLLVNQSPTANFSFSQNGASFTFANLSANADAFFWHFGDGATSAVENPTHVFTSDGAFIVSLWAVNACDTAFYSAIVELVSAPTAAFFVADTLRGCGSVEAHFQNQSSANATEFSWLFSGGSVLVSNEVNPSVTFSASGTYMAALVASNDAGTAAASHSFYVEILPEPTAAFGFSLGQPIQFDNQSTNATSFLWDFGDGQTSMAPAPTHLYSMEGNFVVTLRATNACGTAIAQKTVAFFLPPTANFAAPDTVSSCGAPIQVAFENQSSANVSVFLWSFPGGSPSSSDLPNPVVTYTTSGTYAASLVVGNSAGTDVFSKNIVIKIESLPTANFVAQPGAGGVVMFENQSLGAGTFAWFFGDGATSSEENPTHQYAQTGTYTVTLQAINACGAAVFQQTIEVKIVGTEDVAAAWLRLFPNPAHEVLNLEIAPSAPTPERVRMLDAAGRVCFDKSQKINRLEQLDLRGLPAGTYFLELNFLDRKAVLRWEKI